ncbi:MAG: C10 family peptidase [Bacteroidales bacterium]
MKKIQIVLLLLIISVTVFSQTVTNDEINRVAINFYQFLTKENIAKQNVKIEKQNIHIFRGVETYATVVFDNKDWVVISTDKSIDPILAFSDEGSYADSINPNAKFWFELYDHYVYNAKYHKIYEDENKDFEQLWNDLIANDLGKYSQKSLGSNISPLITTKWGQSKSNDGEDAYAYNYYAPSAIDYYGNICEHALAGCPAVAIGQVLKYWKYPNCAIYNWNNMPNTLNMSDANYLAYKIEIANFLRNIADKMQNYMNNDYFGCEGSGCGDIPMLSALKNDFNFYNAYIMLQGAYSLSEWKNLIYSELSFSRPILYLGSISSKGHIFVCDGYKHIFWGDRFHFNFGWNGSSDGYYAIINPHGYTEKHKTIMNIYPQQIDCNSQAIIYQSDKILDANKFFNPEAGTILSSPSPIVIASEDVVRYKAYDEIVLTNFETDGNADFIAEIIPCPEPHNVDDCGIFYNYKYSTEKMAESANENTLTVSNSNMIKIYPNPSNGIFTLSFETKPKNETVRIYNCLGELILETNMGSKELTIDLSKQPNGIYLLKYSTKKHIYQQKIIKQ